MSLQTEKVLVTRFCRLQQDGKLRSAYNDFLWPRSGPVEAPDWDPVPHCGNGLHGWLEGKGFGSAWNRNPSDVMLVVEVDRQDIVNLDGKVKFPKGNVIFAGSRKEVTKYMAERGHVGIAYGYMIVGDQVEGCGPAITGHNGTAIAGSWNLAVAGDYGKAVAGHQGTAQAGDGGTAQAGNWGKAKAGGEGKAMVDCGGYVSAGLGGEIHIRWLDLIYNRYRTAVGYIGENGLKPDTWYKVDGQGNFMEVVSF